MSPLRQIKLKKRETGWLSEDTSIEKSKKICAPRMRKTWRCNPSTSSMTGAIPTGGIPISTAGIPSGGMSSQNGAAFAKLLWQNDMNLIIR
ncbi:hypothetical protein BGX34_007797 [Mortierella sp. NVP85]|nr:hypothetical protein BGX34_007797 [Mortierella sp. NVP85]